MKHFKRELSMLDIKLTTDDIVVIMDGLIGLISDIDNPTKEDDMVISLTLNILSQTNIEKGIKPNKYQILKP